MFPRIPRQTPGAERVYSQTRRALSDALLVVSLDTDVLIWEGDASDPTLKPPEMYTLIENFCLGLRRLEIFGRARTARRGWVTALAEGEEERIEEGMTLGADDGSGEELQEGAMRFNRERWEAKVKELEAKLLEIEGGASTSASTAAPATTPTAPAPVASTSASAAPAASPVTATPASGKAGLPTSLPPKPTPAPRPPVTAAGRGRGAGAPPARGLSIRGAAPGAAGRGGPAAAAVADAAAANAAGGAKRTREGDAAVDDAAAKRQKQGGAPVSLRRPRPTEQPAPQ